MNHLFSRPQLVDRNGDLNKRWYVSFAYTDPSTKKRNYHQLCGGINRYHTKSERKQNGLELLDEIHDSLNKGWNPNIQCLSNFVVYSKYGDKSSMPFAQAIDWAMEKKSSELKKGSMYSYNSMKGFVLQAATKIGIDVKPIYCIERGDIANLMDAISEIRQAEYDADGKGKVFTGNSYNKYALFLSIIFSKLAEYDVITMNPCSHIKKRTTIKTSVHRHATRKEEIRIKEHIKRMNNGLYKYLAVIELCGIRPVEILSLRICDIDWFNQCFNLDASFTKDKESRKVQIPDSLMPIIQSMSLHNYPSNYYIFSDDLLPGERKITRNIPTQLWKRTVMDRLQINVTMYSFKGLGAEKKLSAGIRKEAVSIGLGHSNTRTTDIYLHRESERNRIDIRQLTPEFMAN